MEDQTQVNIPLLRKVVEWAEAEAAKPDAQSEWCQQNWYSDPKAHAFSIAITRQGWDGTYREMAEALEPECGTAYCIAGYVTAVLSDLPLQPDGSVGKDKKVAKVAADLLGIAPPRDFLAPESGHLFHAQNTIADVRRIAEDIAGERL